MLLLFTRVIWRVLTSAYHVQILVLISTFVLSYAIHFLVYLSPREVERTDLASQNHNFILRTVRHAYFADPHTARANQSASQECRFAPPIKNKPTSY